MPRRTRGNIHKGTRTIIPQIKAWGPFTRNSHIRNRSNQHRLLPISIQASQLHQKRAKEDLSPNWLL